MQSKELYSSGKTNLFNNLALNDENCYSIKKKILGKNFKFKSEILNKSLSVLTYSLSYLSSIIRYKNGEKFVTINQISQNPINDLEKTFCDLRRYFKDCSEGSLLLSFKEVDKYFKNTEYLLNKNV